MTESQCLIVCWYFLPIPVYDGPVSELQIISTSRHLLCRSAANQRASSACCKSFPCSASPPSWRSTRCPTNTAGRGGRALQSLQNSSLCLSFSHSFIIKLEIHNLSNIHAKYLKLLYISLCVTLFAVVIFTASINSAEELKQQDHMANRQLHLVLKHACSWARACRSVWTNWL